MLRLSRFLPIALMMICCGPVAAQLQVSLELDKTQHIVQEAVSATVTVTNRSGTDFITGGPKGQGWLSFEITDATERNLSAVHTDDTKPSVFPAGQTLRRKVSVTAKYVMEQGHYGIKALVYFGPSGQFYESNRARVQVLEGAQLCKPLSFGVPPGFPDAGRTRKYVLLQHQDFNRSYLYIRIVDELSGGMLLTYQLGTLTLFREPQYTLDRNNNLHVMFLTAPTIYRYCVIRPDGQLESQTMLREADADRPKLFLTAENDVVRRGGFVFDPAAERAAMNKAKPKSIGERPPGL
ncbi:MAG: hypothetical protein JNJ83_24705 [Verrucomicrobiaceae bacterium]|nr:hypothetical protein [Verrucomicrobiaceae bacterium]